MSQTKSFHCPQNLRNQLISSIESWLTGENFNVQKLKIEEDNSTLLQVEKKGGWRRFVGMSTALNIIFRQETDYLNVEIGAGRWIDKGVVGAVSLVVLWPLAVTAGVGAWQQSKMPERVYSHIHDFLATHSIIINP
jgi:hypothetical protein